MCFRCLINGCEQVKKSHIFFEHGSIADLTETKVGRYLYFVTHHFEFGCRLKYKALVFPPRFYVIGIGNNYDIANTCGDHVEAVYWDETQYDILKWM